MLKDSQVDLCGRTDFIRTAPLLARDEAFSFACAGCGGCCRGREDIVLSGFDLWRIAARLRLPPRTVARAFCRGSIGRVSRLPVLRLAPLKEERGNCPFLTGNHCAIHDADPLRLEQILINVLANAVKFTPDGGQISLRIVQKDTASADYADFEFHIKDNGIGMSEEFQKHIFEQFARERTSTVSKIQGTGLGLSITKSLVDMMGGRITVKSEQGKGSEFTISLRFPIGEAKTGQTPPAAKASAFTGKKLLVVEDNELNLEIASTLLKEAGFEVDTAENGKIAVEKVEAASADRYDLILMDIQMPEMDGYEATRRIRALPDAKKAALPIVAMTANAFEDDRKNALHAGMNGHIAKPLDIQKLFQVLSELLK